MFIDGDKRSECVVISDLYEQYEKKISELQPVEQAEIYPNRSTLEVNAKTMIAFLYYSQSGVSGHFEAIMQEPAKIASKAPTSIFSPVNLPSYIVYMVFLSVCGFDNNGEFSYVDANSDYLEFPDTPGSIPKILENMYNIYASQEIITAQKGVTSSTNNTPMYLQLGGAIKKYMQDYLLSGYNPQAKNTYYIVIDLDLMPGDTITRRDKFKLDCGTSYDKMREAWADIWGLYYVPGELDTSRFKRDVPTAIPVAEAERTSSTGTQKAPSAPIGGTRRQRQETNRGTRKHEKIHKKTRKFQYLIFRLTITSNIMFP